MDTSQNLLQLKNLVEELDKQDHLSDEYHETIKEIKSVINDEENIINKLKEDGSKLRHYQNICKNILSIIATTNI